MFTVIGFMLDRSYGIPAFFAKDRKDHFNSLFSSVVPLQCRSVQIKLIINNLAAFWMAGCHTGFLLPGSILASWMVLKFSSRR